MTSKNNGRDSVGSFIRLMQAKFAHGLQLVKTNVYGLLRTFALATVLLGCIFMGILWSAGTIILLAVVDWLFLERYLGRRLEYLYFPKKGGTGND
jgi:hypothetical protein